MNKRTTVFVFLLLWAPLVSPWAQEYPSRPAGDEVVIITRIRLDPPIEEDFFKKLIGGAELGKHSLTFQVVPEGQLSIAMKIPLGTLDELSMVKVGIPASRSLILSPLTLRFFGDSTIFITLPLYRRVIIPADANYVYLGTLTYERRGEYFEIEGISKTDEFDGAQDVVRRTYGQDARLYRVNLMEIKQE